MPAGAVTSLPTRWCWWCRPPRRATPQALADLTQPAYARIAIGLPASVPAGRYAKGALDAAGLWATIEPKVIGAHNVRQALDYVARGEVDAGFVYATDAATMPDKVRVALKVPTTGADPLSGGAGCRQRQRRHWRARSSSSCRRRRRGRCWPATASAAPDAGRWRTRGCRWH